MFDKFTQTYLCTLRRYPGFKGTVVNRALSSLHGGLLKITITASLTKFYKTHENLYGLLYPNPKFAWEAYVFEHLCCAVFRVLLNMLHYVLFIISFSILLIFNTKTNCFKIYLILMLQKSSALLFSVLLKYI